MEKTTIKGFLYWDGMHWVAADRPKLKSCCLSKHTPIVLQGDFSAYPSNKILTFQGILSSDRYLSDVQVLEESQNSVPIFSWGLIAGSCLLVAFFFYRSSKR